MAYLHPVRSRPNLNVITGALVRRIVLENGRAVGVAYARGGQEVQARAEREVILCGGAINSPQLLMLSGIGPADHLREHGIGVPCDSAWVGAQPAGPPGHLHAAIIPPSASPTTASATPSRLRLLPARPQRPGNQQHRRGRRLRAFATGAGFERCDIQFHFVPAMLDDHGRNRLPGDGYTLHACFLRPRSRGRIALASANPADKARIEANYLGDAEGFDLKMMVECARLSRELFAQKAFDDYRGAPIAPPRNDLSDAELAQFIRAKAETVYHPVGTCRMGSDDTCVVDSQLRVNGVEGLRVVDASVMPSLIGGNTNAPTIMIAERAADLLLGRMLAV